MVNDCRIITNLKKASLIPPVFGKAKGSNQASKLGLRYENRVYRQLTKLEDRFNKITHNPWFEFEDINGPGVCSPDIVMMMGNLGIIVEVKLSWVEIALRKLNDLYVPVVSAALNARFTPLVVCRNLLPSSPPAAYTVRDALALPCPLLHWADIGSIRW